MKKHFVIYVFLVIIFCKDCSACFDKNTNETVIVKTSSSYYAECCCTDPSFTVKELQWLDPLNRVIGPGTDSNVFIEEQRSENQECVALQVRESSKAVSGPYKCMTKYKGASYTQTYYLDVFDEVIFYNTDADQFLVYGTDSRINCSAKGASSLYIKWYKITEQQEEITEDSGKYKITSEGIIVNNVTNDDAGIYRCTALVPITGEGLEININVKVMTIPTITRLTATPENTVTVGESLFIECNAEGLPAPEFIFEKVPDLLSGNQQKNATWQQNENTINFNYIEAEDAGTYKCYAKNYVGNTSKTIDIKVLVPPEILFFENTTIVEGKEIPIICNAIGDPAPNVSITFEGRSLDQEKSQIYEDFIENNTTFIAERFMEGFYICNATSEVDFVTEIMYLTIQHKPYFNAKEETVWGWNGETVVLNCTNEANPPSTLTWKYIKSETATPTIEEADIYNILSTSQQIYSFPISNEYAPFGIYKCKAYNDLGESYKMITLKKGFIPSVVEQAFVSIPTATTVSFHIEPPTNYEGPEILGYQAEYDIAENYNITHIHRNRTWATGIQYKLEKLKPNSTYYVRIAAINKVGTGPWGERLQFKTLEKAPPEPPMWQVQSDELSPNDVLKWEAPEDNGEPIDYYALRYCPINNELDDVDESLCKEHRIEAGTEQQLSDLQLNTTYYFELIAHNAKGNSTAVNITLVVPALESLESAPLLSGGTIIGISIVAVLVCLLLLDLLLLFWRKQGIIASCCYKSKKKPNTLHSRDKKGLLKDNGESTDDTLRRPNNGHKEYEYNKTTGIITGKHSSV